MDELEKLARDIFAESSNRAGDSDYTVDSGYDTAKHNIGRSGKKKDLIAAASVPEIDMDYLAEKIKERLLKDLTIREALLKINRSRETETTPNSHETDVYHGKTEPNDMNSGRSGGITVKDIVASEEKLNDREETKIKNNLKVSTSKTQKHDAKEILMKKSIYRETDLRDEVSPKAGNNETKGESAEYFSTDIFNSMEPIEASAQNHKEKKRNKKMKNIQNESMESVVNYKEQKKYPKNIQESSLIGYLNEPEKSSEVYKKQRQPKGEKNSKTDSYLNESEETLEDSKEEHKYPKNKEKNKTEKNQNEQKESVENYKPPSEAITENIDWDDYDENNSKVENMPKKTTLPKKPKYESSTPDFFVSSATAEPYKFEEPIPEKDRVPKIKTELKPMIPVKVNGKKVYKILLL